MANCDWYFKCFNQAVGTVKHPVLGDVKTCKRCADKHDLDLKPFGVNPEDIKVGDGVSVVIGSDRYAATVVYVSPSGKTIRYQCDHAVANGPVHDREQYDYTYKPDKTAPVRTARWSAKRLRYMDNGFPLIGGRHQYRDPSF